MRVRATQPLVRVSRLPCGHRQNFNNNHMTGELLRKLRRLGEPSRNDCEPCTINSQRGIKAQKHSWKGGVCVCACVCVHTIWATHTRVVLGHASVLFGLRLARSCNAIRFGGLTRRCSLKVEDPNKGNTHTHTHMHPSTQHTHTHTHTHTRAPTHACQHARADS